MSGTAFGSDLSLTRSQEGLLSAALSSNNADNRALGSPNGTFRHKQSNSDDSQQQGSIAMANSAQTYTSPTQETPGSGQLGSFDESPFIDYENLDDSNFDWDNNGDQLFGDLPDSEFNDAEQHDKRKASSDEQGEEEGSSKRREGDDKTVKKSAQKPGRKPLTGEPTTVCLMKRLN